MDISLCRNDRCLKRLLCHRYTATPSKHWQSYGQFDHKDCEYFWDNKNYPDERKIEEEVLEILTKISKHDGKGK